MQIKKIELHNFRQFRDGSVDFALGEDEDKNVTIILGENTSGKTSFAQAFTWCMYGETSFLDKSVLNKKVAEEMLPKQEERVKVSLSLRHCGVEYTLVREQIFQKEFNNSVKASNTIFNIGIKDKTGNTTYLDHSKCESEVNGILPRELSRYFFFDGERINNMGKEIQAGKKSTDFAEAVKGLVGLNGIISALAHLNPRSKYSVIGSYNSSYDNQSNKKLSVYSAKIDEYNEKLDQLQADLENLDSQIETAKVIKAKKIEELKKYKEGEVLQSEKEKLEKQIHNVQTSRAAIYKAICSDFNLSMTSFFSLTLMKDALDFLAKKDFVGKDIPFINSKTIEYLLAQKQCLCGTHLEEGSELYRKVKELIEFLPPQSISSSVADFKKEAIRRTSKENEILENVREKLGIVSDIDDNIMEMKEKITFIDSQLSDESMHDKVRAINASIQTYEKTILSCTEQKNHCYQEIGALTSERDRTVTQRSELAHMDEHYRKIEICKAYAERVYSELLEVYSSKEKEIRQKLQDTINEIFKKLFDGNLYLTIDEKYHISVLATGYEGEVEASTAQNISVIFAFISGIIKMTREIKSSNDENELLVAETYPLVMDAPLSSYDKKRIKAICNALPEISEQVIIFIKDTDGELAEEYMGNRIGRKLRFNKLNDFETVLE